MRARHKVHACHGRWSTNRRWLHGHPGRCDPPIGGVAGPGFPGLAWAARIEWWQQMGGLLDVCALGSGDTCTALAMTGQIEFLQHVGYDQMAPGYLRALRQYQQRAADGRWEERPLLGNIGIVRGAVAHQWHGPKIDRGYGTRNRVLIEHQFDPYTDLKRDWQGLYQLTNRVPQLRRDVQAYFRARNEDQL